MCKCLTRTRCRDNSQSIGQWPGLRTKVRAPLVHKVRAPQMGKVRAPLVYKVRALLMHKVRGPLVHMGQPDL